MPDMQIHQVEVSDLNGAIENAADGMADSITRALHDKPAATLACLIVWAVSAPVLFLWNAI